jgi:hypothetical protein
VSSVRCSKFTRANESLEPSTDILKADHALRSIQAHNSPPSTKSTEPYIAQANQTATFPLNPGTPFSQASNTFIRDYNTWIGRALDKRKLTSVPCTSIGSMMLQEADSLGDLGSRRIAIMLNEARWERSAPDNTENSSAASIRSNGETRGNDIGRRKGKQRAKDKDEEKGKHGEKAARSPRQILTTQQTEIRKSALIGLVQMMESMEPLLKDASGKGEDEWDRWWGEMMEGLLGNSNEGPMLDGECIEAGAWWGRKL